MKYLLLFFAAALSATVNHPLRWEISSGYRNDRIHLHLQDPGDGGTLTYSELYRDVQYWENALNFKVIHRDLVFAIRGAYGTFGKGTLFQRIPSEPSTRLGTNGWTADGSGFFGYVVNLTAGRTYEALLIPLIGYSGHWERLNPRNMRLSWYGFFCGAGFSINPGAGILFNGGYSYNFLHNRFHTNIDKGSFASMRCNSSGDKGHTGWAQMDFMIDRFWRMGLGAQIHYFFTRVIDGKLYQPTPIPQKFKMRWTAISGWLNISREF